LSVAVFASRLDPAGAAFAANARAMGAGVEAFRAIERAVRAKEESARERFRERGQLLPRARLELLLDRGAPFLELATLAGHALHGDTEGHGAGAGLLAGVGSVAGVRCLVVANNSAIKGGTINPSALLKILRLQQIALENALPLVTLAESGGANLNYATEIFVEGARTFANQARLSAAGIPQLTIVHGSATAGGAYQPGLSDYVIAVRDRARLFLAGPPLLRAATGEIATDEELGGAALHATETGTAEYLAEDDADAIRIARELLARLDWRRAQAPLSRREYAAPRWPAEELLGVVPVDPREPYDVREIVARIADASELTDFKPLYDAATVCVHVSIMGHACGLIGNNAPITPQGAAKAAQFIQLCDQAALPLVFLHNTTGFLVGRDAERGGVIKHGSKMIQAVANARVPRIAVIVGGSYGAGNYAMCGRGLDPRFIFAWPTGRTAVMGAEQAGRTLRIVAEEKYRRAGQQADPERLEQLARTAAAQLEAGSTALFASAQLWDDGLIDPRDTRRVLGFVLDVCAGARRRHLQANTYGVARF
jgi:geranyl-CoA carboxylase beta subunit